MNEVKEVAKEVKAAAAAKQPKEVKAVLVGSIAETTAESIKAEILKPMLANYKEAKESGLLSFRVDYMQPQRIGKETIFTEAAMLLDKISIKELINVLPTKLEYIRQHKGKSVKLVLDNSVLFNIDINAAAKMQPYILAKYLATSLFRQYSNEVDLMNVPLFISYFLTLGNRSVLPNIDAINLYESKRVEKIIVATNYNNVRQATLHIVSDMASAKLIAETETLQNSLNGLLLNA